MPVCRWARFVTSTPSGVAVAQASPSPAPPPRALPERVGEHTRRSGRGTAPAHHVPTAARLRSRSRWRSAGSSSLARPRVARPWTRRPRWPRAQGDEGLAAWRVQRTDDEVGLASEAGADAGVDPRGVGLAEEVHLECGVHRGHPALLGDEARSFVFSVRSMRTHELPSIQS